MNATLTPHQESIGCWVCACGSVRMVWDVCGCCGEMVDSRLTPDRLAVYQAARASARPVVERQGVDP